MIEKNIFGQIEPRIGCYFIRKNSKGKYEILKSEPCLVTKAVIANPYLLWTDIESFDSMVKAYAWLKQNVNNLL